MGKKESICSNPFRGRSTKCKLLTGAIVLIGLVILSLIGWGISKAVKKTPIVSVILPLYIYPGEGAWEPVYTAVDKYPDLQFLVVINPNNGPGNQTLLDPNYERELPLLNSRKNVRTVGYVRTTWATRNINDVYTDVSVYSSWADNKTQDYQMHGIFYDEAPTVYTDAGLAFMNSIDSFAKNQAGFGGVNYVVHNPGTIPDDYRLFASADCVVVFENGYANYTSGSKASDLLNLPEKVDNFQRQNFAYMVNGVPETWSQGDMKDFLSGLDGGAQYLFATDRSLSGGDSIYDAFGTNWEEFTQAMGSLN